MMGCGVTVASHPVMFGEVMITRRGFAGILGVGVLFPKNLIKALGKNQKTDQKGVAELEGIHCIDYSKVPDKICVTSLGTDERPATQRDADEYNTHLREMGIVSQAISNGRPVPYPWQDMCLPPHLLNHWSCNFLQTPFLVLAVGNYARPVSYAEVAKFRAEVVHRLTQGENLIITKHAITPYVFHSRLRGGDSIVPRFPQVRHHGDAKFQCRIGMLSRDMSS